MNAKKLSSLMGNRQRLDGGAMFGNAPKVMWQKWVSPDENNLIPLACRALLIEEPERNILCETGVGAFFSPKLKERFGVAESEHVLLDSLAEKDLTHEDIDIIILSHLHFDHAGGLLSGWQEGSEPTLLFPNAKYIVSEKAWQRAQAPHPRDRASFIPQLNELLQKSGRLEIVESNKSALLGEDYCFHFSEGHTPGLMLTEVKTTDGPVVFAGDLIPGTHWVHVPITMGYDRFPEQLIDEKKALLQDLFQRQGKLFFTHDNEVALSGIGQDDKGRFSATAVQHHLDRVVC